MKRFLKILGIVFVIGILLMAVAVSGKIGWNRQQTNKNFFGDGEKKAILAQTTKENSFYAGVSQKIITPDKSVYLGGFNFNRKSTGVHDNLYARVLVLGDGYGTRIVIVSLDLLGFLRPDVLQIQREIEIRGIAFGQNVIITSTHTHGAPDMIGYYGNILKGESGRNFAYAKFVANQIIEAAEEAFDRPEPVDLYTSVADGGGLCGNKRFPEIIDNEIRTFFVAYKSGKIAATIVNFGCHPEVLDRRNTLITADWPGYMSDNLEQRLGGKAFFVNGALGGMVTPTYKGDYKLAEKFGGEIAYRVAESYQRRIKILPPYISTFSQEIEIPLQNQLFKYLIWFGFIPGGTFYDGKIVTEVNYLQIGNLQVITVPGEITPQVGIKIKSKLKEPKMVWSLANDEIGYILQKEDWSHQKYSYERTMSLGSETGPKVMAAVDSLKSVSNKLKFHPK